MSGLSQRIREKRQREGLSLREAGEASGVAFSTLGRIEAGSEPSMEVFRKITSWLDGNAPILPPPPMTLRDWFAGQAIGASWDAAMQFSPSGVNPEDFAAAQAYRIADTMLAARQQDQPHD